MYDQNTFWWCIAAGFPGELPSKLQLLVDEISPMEFIKKKADVFATYQDHWDWCLFGM